MTAPIGITETLAYLSARNAPTNFTARPKAQGEPAMPITGVRDSGCRFIEQRAVNSLFVCNASREFAARHAVQLGLVVGAPRATTLASLDVLLAADLIGLYAS